MSIHVRQIIATFSYAQLVRDKIIPDVKAYLQPTESKRYPPFVYASKNFSYFGMFMDYAVRGYLRIYSSVHLGQDNIYPQADTNMIALYENTRNMNEIVRASDYFTSLRFSTVSPYSASDLARYVPTLTNICKSLLEQLQQYSTVIPAPYHFNVEHNCADVTAHPDITTNTAILDIKNTTSFAKMAEESILQVLAYYALLRQSQPEIVYIGFVLPMQRCLSLCHVANWDSSRYLQLLLSQGQTLTLYLIRSPPMVVTAPELGSHIVKGNDLVSTFQEQHYPTCQMFLTNPRGTAARKLDDGELAAAAQVLANKGIKYFTHAPYVLNLCKPIDAMDNWIYKVLKSDLEHTRALGGRGVVVHTGQYTTQNYEIALSNMEAQVRQVLGYASRECPLLLETPCGEGTEVCTTVQQLAEFFERFSEQERQKLGLCVDTCHVFAAGYDPLQYIQQWQQRSRVEIRLVHYNDSKDEFGSRKDHHMIPGLGYIGPKRMRVLLEYCIEQKIPMVRE